jgi:hypothetical protein
MEGRGDTTSGITIPLWNHVLLVTCTHMSHMREGTRGPVNSHLST